MSDQLEGRNVVFEALSRGRRKVRVIRLDERAQVKGKLEELLQLAARLGVKVQPTPRFKLDEMSQTGVHNGVIAIADPLPELTVKGLLEEKPWPFVVAVDEVRYEHNLGAILRTACGAGVDALVVPAVRGKGITPVVQRVAMGGAEVVPVIREGLSSALSTFSRSGLRVVGCDMKGSPLWQTPLLGPIVLVLGGEDKGLSPTLRNKCDDVVALPLAHGLDSLNVSVTAGIVIYEKLRQERTAST